VEDDEESDMLFHKEENISKRGKCDFNIFA